MIEDALNVRFRGKADIAWVVFCEYTPWMDLIYIVSIWLLPVLIAITFH